MRYHLLGLILIFTGPASTRAQVVLQGVILTEDGRDPSGAIVSLSDLVGGVVDYQTIENRQARWQLKAPRKGLYRCEVRLLGYETYDTLLRLVSDTLFLPVVLKPEIFELSGVEVTAHFSRKVQVMGDTTRFYLSGYLDGTERYLEDVLVKMPGVEITEDRRILFYGKQVKKLLIDGHDILNDRHEFALEAIDIASVKSIDFIEHYREGLAQKEAHSSEDVAMDVHFKESAKGKLSGSLTTLYAPLSRYLAHLDLLSVSDKIAYTVFMRNNSVSEPVLSLGDYMKLQTSSGNILAKLNQMNKAGAITEAGLLPSGFTLSNDLRFSNDALWAANLSLRPSRKVKFKFSFLGARLQRQRIFALERIMFADDSRLEGNQEEETITNLAGVQTSLEWAWSKKYLSSLEFKTLSSGVASIAESKFLDIANGLTNASMLNEKQREFSGNFQVKYLQDAYTSHRFQWEFFSQRQENTDTFLFSDTVFIPVQFDASGFILYDQQLISNKSGFLGKWVYSKKSNFGKYVISLQGGRNKEHLLVQNFLPQQSPAPERLTNYAGPNFFLNIERPHWWIRLKMQALYTNLTQGVVNFSFWSRDIHASVNYLPEENSKRNKLYVKYLHTLSPPSFESTNAYLLMADERKLIQGNINPERALPAYHSLSIGWHLQKPLSNISFLNIYYTYSHEQPQLIESWTSTATYWSVSYQLTDYPIKTSSIYATLRGVSIPFHLYMDMDLRFSHTDFLTFTGNNFFSRSRQQGINGSLSLQRSFFKNKLKLGVGYQFRYMNSNTLLSSYGFTEHTFRASYQLSPAKRWLLKGKLYSSIFIYEELRRAIWDIDINFEYNFNDHWQFLLRGRRLANLKGQFFQTSRQTLYYTEIKTYRTIPGYLSIGVRKKW